MSKYKFYSLFIQVIQLNFSQLGNFSYLIILYNEPENSLLILSSSNFTNKINVTTEPQKSIKLNIEFWKETKLCSEV